MNSPFINYLLSKKKMPIGQYFREERFLFFKNLLQKVKHQNGINILDVGGTESYWESMNFSELEGVSITVLNLDAVPVKKKNFTSIKGNACDLSQFPDQYFDIVYSNSLIEHLFTKQNQEKMAKEVRRVGKHYFIQTPNYFFPIEPHWRFPFFQFLPFSTRVFLTQNFNLGHYQKTNNRNSAITRVGEVKLLSEKEMKQLFPDGKVYKEKFFGLTKSIIMHCFPEN